MSRQDTADQGFGPGVQAASLSEEPAPDRVPPEDSQLEVGEPAPIASRENDLPEGSPEPLEALTDQRSSADLAAYAKSIFDVCEQACRVPGDVTAREQALLKVRGTLEQYAELRADQAASLRVADHEREELTLRQMLKASADIIQAIPSGLLLYQYQPPGELFFLNCNAEARRLTGMEADDCRGAEFDEIWPNARSQGITEALLRTASTGEPFETSRAYFRKGKIERLLWARAFAMPGNRLGLAFEDITERRLAEEALRKSEEQLTSLVEERTSALFRQNCILQEEIERLAQVEHMSFQAGRATAQEEMAGSATRTLSPLVRTLEESALRASTRLEAGYLSLVKPSIRETLEAAQQIKEIVQRLRQFSRVSPEGAALERKVFDLRDAVREGLERVQTEAGLGEFTSGGAGRQWDLTLDQACPVRGEPSEMVDVVAILVKNAVESTTDAAAITIQAYVEEDIVVLQVGDRGTGIPVANLSKAFEPFSTSKPAHAGLGLAAAEGVVRRLGGSMHAEAAEGQGATFTVRLPRADLHES